MKCVVYFKLFNTYKAVKKVSMSYKNYFPIHLFLVLEKTNAIMWNSKTSEPFSNNIWLQNEWLITLHLLISHDIYFYPVYVLDQSVIDNKFNNKTYNCRYLMYTLITSYQNKFKWIIFTSVNDRYLRLNSIEHIFPNTNWLEREWSEMYGFTVSNKNDTRKLLLDYAKIEHPLLKDFPSEGVNDLYYNILNNQVGFSQQETIEL